MEQLFNFSFLNKAVSFSIPGILVALLIAFALEFTGQPSRFLAGTI